MKTGFSAVKLATAGFIVPFMFVYSPELLLINTTLLDGIRVVTGACMGVFLIGVAVEGYLFTKVNPFFRILAFGCAFGLIDSGVVTDLIGLAGLVLIVLIQYFLAKRERGHQ